MPLTELFNDDVPFRSTGNDEDYFVRASNVLSSDTFAFSFESFDDNTLTVGGAIVATNSGVTSVSSSGPNTVNVLTGGSITGFNAVEIGSDSRMAVFNNGDIVGLQANGIESDFLLEGVIVNNGNITGNVSGIDLDPAGDTGAILELSNSGNIVGETGVRMFDATIDIVNTGAITGHDVGLETSDPGSPFVDRIASILNTGVIAGTEASILAGDGSQHIDNSGQLLGDVFLGDDNDRIDTRSGLVSGDIDLGDGNDVAIGSQEDDIIIAGAGDDIVRAGGDDDTVTGGDGNDILRGAGGDDDLRGENDDDLIFGGTGDDVIRGNTGNDELRGGTGDDNVAGGSGDDEINGGRGDDMLTGNSGADVFVFGATAGNDTITDFRIDLDTIDLSAYGTRFNRVDAATEVVNGNAIIDLDMLGGEGTIVVLGVGGNLDANDFIF